MKTQIRRAFDEHDSKGGEDHDAEVRSITRPAPVQVPGTPVSPMSRPSTASASKVGTWMTRNQGNTTPIDSTAHLAGRIRPSTAMARSTESTRSYARPNQQEWSSDGWRSISRSDFRPPSSKLQPPRLDLPTNNTRRPMSAQPYKQPLIRAPGAPQAPVGSTSGFRL